MPVMDGYATAKNVVQTPLNKNLSIIFPSTFLKIQRDIIKGYKFGTIDYVVFDFHENNLSELVSSVIDEFSVLSFKTNISIAFHRPDFDGTIVLEKDKIKQFIRKILNNSFSYSHQNSDIETKIEEERENILLSILDIELGVSENELEGI
ncbi:hypothetical protein KKA14_12090, partial [bacterium]|nr:hypothetical protein [bacterium]